MMRCLAYFSAAILFSNNIFAIEPLIGEPRPQGSGNLYLLAVALNQSPDKKEGQSIDSWNYCAEEMEKVLREQSIHRGVHSKLILGAKATREGVMEGLAWLNKS